MKTGKNIYKIVFLIVLSILIGCRPAAVSKEKSQSKNKKEQVRFDPLELPSDTVIVTKTNPQLGDLIGTKIVLDENSNLKDSTYNKSEKSFDTLSSQSFRIQLFSSKVFGVSKRAQVVAEEIFDREVFLDYEVPYYKIRVGNFSNREDAELYLQKVRTAGYSDAWVVAVNINVRESERLYQGGLPQLESDN